MWACLAESAAQLDLNKKIMKACDLYLSKAKELARQERWHSKRTPEESAAIRTRVPASFWKKGDAYRRAVTILCRTIISFWMSITVVGGLISAILRP